MDVSRTFSLTCPQTVRPSPRPLSGPRRSLGWRGVGYFVTWVTASPSSLAYWCGLKWEPYPVGQRLWRGKALRLRFPFHFTSPFAFASASKRKPNPVGKAFWLRLSRTEAAKTGAQGSVKATPTLVTSQLNTRANQYLAPSVPNWLDKNQKRKTRWPPTAAALKYR